MSEPDTRETLDPAWEKLARARSELVWNVRYCELWSPQREPTARARLAAWERTHAAEWNRLKPWYEVRLAPTMSPEEARAQDAPDYYDRLRDSQVEAMRLKR